MTYEHIKALARDDPTLDDMCTLIHDIQRGDIPPATRHLITDARGIALIKDTQGGIRPIAILESLTRLAAGLLANANMATITEELGLHEFGMGVAGGAEVLAHVLAAALEDTSLPTPLVMSLDVSNAFNAVERQGQHGLLAAVRAHAPALWPYANLMYGADTQARYHSRTSPDTHLNIQVQRGVAQGDPLGPAFFALTVAPSLASLRHSVTAAPEGGQAPGLLLSYFDDITIVTSDPSRAAELLKEAAASLRKHGLSLSTAKCEAYLPGGASEELQASLTQAGLTKPVSQEGITIAGAAIGTNAFKRDHCMRIAGIIVSQIDLIAASLRDPLNPIKLGRGIPTRQGLALLLRLAEVSRFNYYLRAMPPSATREAAQTIDAAAEALLAALANFDLAAPPPLLDPDLFRQRAHLPLRNGGAGITGQADTAEAAWLAAVTQAAQHLRRHAPNVVEAALLPQPQHVPAYVMATRDAMAAIRSEDPALQQLMEGLDPFDDLPIAPAGADRPPRLQQRISKAQNDCRENRVTAHLNACQPPHGKHAAAAFLSATRGGGAWLAASPAFPQNRLDDVSFSTALALRLGVPFTLSNGNCPLAGCAGLEDAHGDHAFRCTALRNAGGTRHKFVNDTLIAISKDAGFAVQKEIPYELHYPRKADAPQQEVVHRIDALVTMQNGIKLAIDTTVRHPTHGSSHTTPGAAAKAGAKEKRTWISARYTVPEHTITPFALETHGYIGEDAKAYLQTAARSKTGTSKTAYAQQVDFYRSRIAIAVQRGNAVAISRWLSCRLAAAQIQQQGDGAG
jgi:hypothetical protein